MMCPDRPGDDDPGVPGEVTESPVSIRATARVGAHQPRRRGIPTLVPHRRPGYLGSIHVLQLLVVEVVVIAVTAAFGLGMVAAAIAAAIAALLLVVTLGRQGGRWWIEHRVISWRLHRRDRIAGSLAGDDPRLAALRMLAPGVTIDEVGGADDSLVGVARDSAGWYAVAEITANPGLRATARPPVPLDTLAAALNDADQSGAAVVQVVTHTVPAAASDDEAGRSYRDLLQRYGPAQVPVEQTTWIAVRLDAVALAEVGADLPEGAPDLVAALLRQLAKSLRRAGLGTRLLDRGGLLDALDRSCDLTVRAGAAFHVRNARVTPPHEDWHGWHSGRLTHRSYWLRDWPSVAQAGALLDWLATTPAALTSIALTLAPNGDTVDIRCLARIAATSDRLKAVSETLTAGAHTASADLFTLDGEQRPAVYATAPTGGGPR